MLLKNKILRRIGESLDTNNIFEFRDYNIEFVDFLTEREIIKKYIYSIIFFFKNFYKIL